MVLFKLLLLLTIAFQTKGFPDVKRYIIDVDLGIDDYQALVLMIDADNRKQIKIEAITCSKGNTELKHVLDNVFRLLETAGRTDIPVYAGAYSEIIPHPERIERFFGLDGFGDLSYSKKPNLQKLRKTISPVALNEILKRSPKKISLMILGPNTNIAISLTLYKDFANLIREIVIMGGNYGERKIEFNILGDAEAAYNVLKLANCPITLFTWQACVADPITYGWRFNISGISNPVWDLLDRAEFNRFGNESATDNWNSCDPITAFIALHPRGIKKQSEHHATVGLAGEDRALILIDDQKAPNVNIIEQIDVALYKEIFVKAHKNICANKKCRNIYL